MRTKHIAIVIVLLSSVSSSLPAQENPVPIRGAPNAGDYKDVLPKGKKTKIVKEVKSRGMDSPLADAGSELPMNFHRIPMTLEPEEQVSLNFSQRTRLLREAQIRLDQVAERLKGYVEAAQVVMDKDKLVIDQALKAIRAWRERNDVRSQSVGEERDEGAKEKTVGEAQPLVVKDESRHAEETKVDKPVGKGLLLLQVELRYRWAEQLRAIADQMVKEADQLTKDAGKASSRGN